MKEPPYVKGISLPISDWILIFFFFCLYPVTVIGGLVIIGILVSDIVLITIIIIITIMTAIYILYLQLLTHNELKLHAEKVGYVHFRPSMKDNYLQLFIQIFTYGFQGVLLFIIFNRFLTLRIDLWGYLVISGLFSTLMQLIKLISAQLDKRKLFKTAQEPIPLAIKEDLLKNFPISHKISRYHFTDIKPASLFLSAGVTTSGIKLSLSGIKIDSTCVISRYFQWKLSHDELLSVLSHEQGHVHGNDIRNIYLLYGTDGWLRAIKFFSFFLLYSYFQELINLGEDYIAILILFILILALILASTALTAIQRNKIYLNEIRADEYGSLFVGNNKMADVLKKLPSVIPAPVDDSALGFLGFRVEILRNRARDLKEPQEIDKSVRKIYKVY